MSIEKLATLRAELEELKTARRSGIKRIIFNERDVTYKSDEDMRKAIRDLEDEIAGLDNPRRARRNVVLTTFRSGLRGRGSW